MPFGVTPVVPEPVVPAAEPTFVQWQSQGVNLGVPDIQIVNFVSPLKATRGVGENRNVLTVTGPLPPPPHFEVVWRQTASPDVFVPGFVPPDGVYQDTTATELVTQVDAFAIMHVDSAGVATPVPNTTPIVWTSVATNLAGPGTLGVFPITTGIVFTPVNGFPPNWTPGSINGDYPAVSNQISIEVSAVVDGVPATKGVRAVLTPNTFGAPFHAPGTYTLSYINTP